MDRKRRGNMKSFPIIFVAFLGSLLGACNGPIFTATRHVPETIQENNSREGRCGLAVIADVIEGVGKGFMVGGAVGGLYGFILSRKRFNRELTGGSET